MCLPGLVKSVQEMMAKINEMGEVPAMMKKTHEELLSLSTKMSDSEVTSDANRSGDTETIVCMVGRITSVLEYFGISLGAQQLDLPLALASLASMKNAPGGQTHGHGYYTCDCGCGEVVSSVADVSKPPPTLPSPSSLVTTVVPAAPMGFLSGTPYPMDVGPGLPYPAQPSFPVDQRNNNVPQGSLVHQPQPQLPSHSLSQSHTSYLNEFRLAMGGATGYSAAMKRSHDESHYSGSSKKPN